MEERAVTLEFRSNRLKVSSSSSRLEVSASSSNSARKTFRRIIIPRIRLLLLNLVGSGTSRFLLRFNAVHTPPLAQQAVARIKVAVL